MTSPTVPQRASYFPPPYRSQRVLQLRLGCQVAGGVWSPNGKVVGDRITGGSAKKILILVQRNQILLARSYFLCEDAPGRMSMLRFKSHSAYSFSLGFFSGSPPALQLFCGFAPLGLLPVGEIAQ